MQLRYGIKSYIKDCGKVGYLARNFRDIEEGLEAADAFVIIGGGLKGDAKQPRDIIPAIWEEYDVGTSV